MVERHARNRARQRTLDNIGGVEASAESDLEQQHIGRMAREQEKSRRRLDFKYRDRMFTVSAFAFGKRGRKFVVCNELAAAGAANAAERQIDSLRMKRQ